MQAAAREAIQEEVARAREEKAREEAAKRDAQPKFALPPPAPAAASGFVFSAAPTTSAVSVGGFQFGIVTVSPPASQNRPPALKAAPAPAPALPAPEALPVFLFSLPKGLADEELPPVPAGTQFVFSKGHEGVSVPAALRDLSPFKFVALK